MRLFLCVHGALGSRTFVRFFFALFGHFVTGDNARKGTILARLPTGTVTSVATVLDTAKTFNNADITNAAHAKVTINLHGFNNGDVVLVSSGWSRLNMRAYRVANKTSNDFELEGADTSNTGLYSPNGGGGAVQKVVTWVDLDKTLNHSSSGGDPKTVNVKFIESEVEIVLNDGFNAITRNFEMDADQIGTPGYSALKLLSDTDALTVVRQRSKSGAQVLLPARVAFNEEVTLTEGQIMTVRASINAQNKSTRYAS